jgi:hypothetical protein
MSGVGLSVTGQTVVGHIRHRVVVVEREATMREDMTGIESRRVRGIAIRQSTSDPSGAIIFSPSDLPALRDAIYAAIGNIELVPDIEPPEVRYEA